MVGTWSDGRPVYERTFYVTPETITGSNSVKLYRYVNQFPAENVEKLIDIFGTRAYNTTDYSGKPLQAIISIPDIVAVLLNGTISISGTINKAIEGLSYISGGGIPVYIKIRYIKTA